MDFLFYLIVLFIGFALGYAFKQTGNKNPQPSAEVDKKIFELQNEKNSIEEEKNNIKNEKSNLEGRFQNTLSQMEEHKKRIQKLENEHTQTTNENSELKAEKREKQAQLQAEQEKLEELKSQFEKQKEALKNEFKVVSEEIMENRQKNLSEQNKESMGAILKPLKEQLDGFKSRINEVHTKSIQDNTSLKEEIKKVMEVGLEMREEATRLSSALKGDSQKRGAWGEAQLERTLEMSGLIEGEHYEKQASHKDETGNFKRPDFLIKLPENKHMIIDSKVALNIYDKALSTTTEEERKQAMDDFVKSVKKHINDLESKNYSSLKNIDSPFVLMFMPIEPAYIEALKHDKSLFGYGYDKGIILISHTTLIPILKTVSNLWKTDKSHKEARQISEKADDIYSSIITVFNRFEKLGNTLNTASNQYNDTVTALAGKQGLEGKVKRFKEISRTAKDLPDLEKKYIQYDNSKLKRINVVEKQTP